MKKTFLLFVALFLSVVTSCSDSGTSADAAFDASGVCPTEGLNAYGELNRGTFKDARDGQVYKYTTIGKQVWMAQNLNFDNGNSPCADSLCTIERGRIYLTSSALAACPSGWHLPSDAEWQILFESMGGVDSAGYRLKATEGWTPINSGWQSNGTDDCGFALKPIPMTESYENKANGEKHDGYSALVWTSSPAPIAPTLITVIFETQNLHARIANACRGFLSVRCVKN